MKVRFCLPVLICLARAWTISGEFRNLWKFVKQRMAELPGWSF